jgi:hypothetical protein
MKIIGVIVAMMCTAVRSPAEAEKAKPVERGSTVSISMQFKSQIQLESALLIWKTFDDVPAKQKGMATSFICSGNFAQTSGGITISCGIPSDVADGRYYLISVSVGANQHRRTYNWLGELPSDLGINVKGGSIIGLPDLKAIQISGTNTSKE